MDEQLKQVGFKPGKGMVYTDRKGNKYVAHSKPSRTHQKVGYMMKDTGVKVHMSKKQRKRVKAILEAQKEQSENKPQDTLPTSGV